MAKYCASCKKLSEDDNIRFCPACGSSQFIHATLKTPAAEPVKPAEDVQQTAPVIPPVNTNISPAPKKKSGGKKVVVAVISVCLVIALTLGVLAVSGVFSKSFGSDKSRLIKVEQSSIEESCNSYEAIYEQYFNAGQEKKKCNVKMDLTLSDDILKGLSANTGVSTDLNWLKNIGFDATINSDDSKISANTIISIDQQQVLNTALFADAANGQFFLKLNEITDDVLKFKYDIKNTLDTPDIDTNFVADILPEASAITGIIKKYHGIYLDNLTDIVKSSEEVTIDGISETLTVYSCDMSEKDVSILAGNIMNELKTDNEIKTILGKIQKALQDKGLYDKSGDLCDSFIKETDEKFKELYGTESQDKIVLKICDYVNGNNELVGRKIEEKDEVFRHVTVKSGDKFSKIIESGKDVTFKETGTQNGDRVTGECVLTVDGETAFKIGLTDFDREAFKKGDLDGKIRFFPGSDAIKDATPSNLKAYAGLLDMSFEIDIKGNNEAGKCKWTVLNGEKTFLTIDEEYSTAPAETVTEPKGKQVEFKGLDTLEEILGDLHLDQFVGNLRKTSVPKEYVDAIEKISNQLKSVA